MNTSEDQAFLCQQSCWQCNDKSNNQHNLMGNSNNNKDKLMILCNL
jgi:hypothetical protein